MEVFTEKYTKNIKKQIMAKLELINENFQSTLTEYWNNSRARDFHKYYLEVTGNLKTLKDDKLTIISGLKKNYSIQVMSQDNLQEMARNLNKMIELVNDEGYLQLYIGHFSKIKVVTKGNKILCRNQASFYTKFMHTVSPAKFAAMDSYVREYFNLKEEGFLFSYFLINDCYLEWASKNKTVLNKIRTDLKQIPCIETISDLKILDMYFWQKGYEKKNPQPEIKK